MLSASPILTAPAAARRRCHARRGVSLSKVRAASGPSAREPWDLGRFVKTVTFFNPGARLRNEAKRHSLCRRAPTEELTRAVPCFFTRHVRRHQAAAGARHVVDRREARLGGRSACSRRFRFPLRRAGAAARAWRRGACGRRHRRRGRARGASAPGAGHARARARERLPQGEAAAGSSGRGAPGAAGGWRGRRGAAAVAGLGHRARRRPRRLRRRHLPLHPRAAQGRGHARVRHLEAWKRRHACCSARLTCVLLSTCQPRQVQPGREIL